MVVLLQYEACWSACVNAVIEIQCSFWNFWINLWAFAHSWQTGACYIRCPLYQLHMPFGIQVLIDVWEVVETFDAIFLCFTSDFSPFVTWRVLPVQRHFRKIGLQCTYIQMRGLSQKGKAGLPRTSLVLGVVLLSAWSPLVDKLLMLHLQVMSPTNRSFVNAIKVVLEARWSSFSNNGWLNGPLHLDPCLRIDVCKGKDTFAYVFIWRSEHYFKPEENSLWWFSWKWSQL